MALTPKQRERRKSGLFATDISRIMLGNSVQVALEKLGQVDDSTGPDPVEIEAGKKVERLILDAYEHQTSTLLMERSPDSIFHPQYEWMGAHLDARVNPKKNAEAKSVDELHMGHLWGNPGTDEVNDYVMWQAQAQMSVSGAEVTDIPVCFLNTNSLKYLLVDRLPPISIFVVYRDLACEKMLVEKSKYVWDCIQREELPAAEKPSDVRLIYKRDNGDVIEATEEIFNVYISLMEARHQLKSYEELKEKLTFQIQEYMKSAAVLKADGASFTNPSEIRFHGKTLVTWKNNKDGFRPDIKELEDSYPDVYKAILKPRPGPRVFLSKEMR